MCLFETIKLERKIPECLILSVNNTKNEFENEQYFKSYLHMCYFLKSTVHFGLKLFYSLKLSFMKRSKQTFIDFNKCI